MTRYFQETDSPEMDVGRDVIRTIRQTVTGGTPVIVTAASIGLSSITAVVIDTSTISGFAQYVECLAGSSPAGGAEALPPVIGAGGVNVTIDHNEAAVAHDMIVLVVGRV